MLVLACAQACPAPLQAAPADAAARLQFNAALAQLRAPPNDSPVLRAYLLYPYLEAERLRAALARPAPPDVAIAGFLSRHGQEPVARDLRRDWLGSLARRKLWDPFLAHYDAASATDGLRCEHARALIATAGAPAAIADARQLYLTGRTLPDSCNAVFDWLREQGQLPAARILERARLAATAGNAELLAGLARGLPPAEAAAVRSWARLLNDPNAELGRILGTGRAGLIATEPVALAAGFEKLARRDPAAAEKRFAAIEALCGERCPVPTPASIADLRRDLALGMAWSRLDGALAQFRVFAAGSDDDLVHEWRVRSALWQRSWKQALAWIQGMPPRLAEQPRWRYWRARSLAALGGDDEARALYDRLAVENGYYGALAAMRIGRGAEPRSRPIPDSPDLQAAIAQRPAFRRIRELQLSGHRAWAANEWYAVVKTLDRIELQQAAHVAASWGWYLLAVDAATRAGEFDDLPLLYPEPYREEVAAGARLSGLSPIWLYSVMRQESLFDPLSRSAADARGLLQLLPATAREVARRWKLPVPSADALFDPATNVPLGAAHLEEQRERFGGRWPLVLAGYNAGPSAVQRWLPDAPLDADIWIENVPYNETRAYIQKILWHAVVYGYQSTGQPQRLDPLMQPIPAQGI